jgi:primosomal protein N' (replication factor Y)
MDVLVEHKCSLRDLILIMLVWLGLNADNMLYHPDFRAFERSFQMMTQVAGRDRTRQNRSSDSNL